VIHVEDDHRERVAVSEGALQLVGELLTEVAVVVQAGQAVVVGDIVEALAEPL
jgi:hypothetical protein